MLDILEKTHTVAWNQLVLDESLKIYISCNNLKANFKGLILEINRFYTKLVNWFTQYYLVDKVSYALHFPRIGESSLFFYIQNWASWSLWLYNTEGVITTVLVPRYVLSITNMQSFASFPTDKWKVVISTEINLIISTNNYYDRLNNTKILTSETQQSPLLKHLVLYPYKLNLLNKQKTLVQYYLVMFASNILYLKQ